MLTLYANFKGGTGKSTVVFNMAMWRLAFRRSFSEGLAVFELEPNGKAAGELDTLVRAIHGTKSPAR